MAERPIEGSIDPVVLTADEVNRIGDLMPHRDAIIDA